MSRRMHRNIIAIIVRQASLSLSLSLSPYLRCARVLSVPQVARTFDAVEAKAVAWAACAARISTLLR